ncbi:UvrD-helicase domain-containing protein [uncultured Gordonia sp.]|uniref:UvrD-helicase domain-containing protein n=1 Tax=uncultured Gordonia sp. TaxID=198437 RepID=UPI00258C7BED|nr:UvrD-helicase domain-containing protein [uncultured Gordonia sp.]
MNDRERPAFELDAAQRRVVEAPADERLMVVAGAGQGKTEVVAERLAFLIDDEGLSASAELLVLSFSRAAVHAVRSRLSSHDVAEVNVRTFDSFASQVLLEAGEEPAGGFDERVRQATRLLREEAEGTEWIADFRHVVLDEVQDLVGDRAEFVLAVVALLPDDAGLTALGDPLQAVYDFVLDESESQTTSTRFLDQLIATHGVTEVGLLKNYRARGADCIRMSEIGVELRGVSDANRAREILTEFRWSLPRISRVDEWGFLAEYAGRSAILCRSNAEVLRISRALIDAGVAHAVRRPAQAFGAAKWIGRALGSVNGPIAARSVVEQRLGEVLGESAADDAWYLLKSTERRAGSLEQVDLGRVRRRIASANVPLSLTQEDEADVVVSTIHRAKGLEFDNVFLADRRDPQQGEQDLWAQVRLEYVALTRASERIVAIDTARARTLVTQDRWLPGRHQERVGPKGRTRARALEIGYADTYVARPIGVGEYSAAAVQDVLDSIAPGAAVDAQLDSERSDSLRPVYALIVDGRPIGITTDDFGTDFAAVFKVRSGLWPYELTDMVLVSVETTTGDPRIAEDAGLGPGGFWLVPRIAGLARPLWDVMEKVG